MTDDAPSRTRYRLPWTREQMRRVAAAAPALRAMPKNPAILIGAAVVGVLGVLAWRNRDRIARTTTPLIEDAKQKSQELIQDAKARGQEIIEEAKATTQTVARKARRSRRAAGTEPTPIPPAPSSGELH